MFGFVSIACQHWEGNLLDPNSFFSRTTNPNMHQQELCAERRWAKSPTQHDEVSLGFIWRDRSNRETLNPQKSCRKLRKIKKKKAPVILVYCTLHGVNSSDKLKLLNVLILKAFSFDKFPFRDNKINFSFLKHLHRAVSSVHFRRLKWHKLGKEIAATLLLITDSAS